MCGVAGYIGSREVPEARRAHCLESMKRRGPDAQRQATFRSGTGVVHLLHSRLSIVDLDERSNQPFRYDQGCLSYNGEIYNHLELRRSLAAMGVNLATEGDTEVLAAGLALEGRSFLDRCEGMWAFAWWQSRDGTLLLSRDRFGEKPLYIWEADDGLYFGSELKFIFALAGRQPPVNITHLKRYLVNGYKSLHKRYDGVVNSFFHGIRELPPGTWLTIGVDGKVQEQTAYWRPEFRQDPGLGFADAVAGTRDRLIRSMELRLRADVPLAFCFSGGIDSNSLVGIAHHAFGHPVHAFTVMNTDARYEERTLVELAVMRQGVRFTPIELDRRNFLPRLREQIRYHDAPISTISYYAQWMVQQAISAEGYRVSVSGTGADELFSGYYDHHNAYLYEMRGDPACYATALANWQREQAPIVRNPFLKDPELFIRRPDERGHIFLDAATFANCLSDPFLEPFIEERFAPGLLRNRMANELFRESVPVILREDDLNAMYYAVENRSPFLDRALFEFSQTIPTRHLVQNGRAKAVLREAMRGLAPDEILDNPRKVGFNAPILDLLDLTDPAVIEWVLADGPIFDLVRRQPIMDLLHRTEMANSVSKFLFYFINAKIFLEEFQQ